MYWDSSATTCPLFPVLSVRSSVLVTCLDGRKREKSDNRRENKVRAEEKERAEEKRGREESWGKKITREGNKEAF